MREIKYQLVKEDYKNWIHWNVMRHDSKKMKIATVVIFIAFAVILISGNLQQAEGNPAALVPSFGLVAAIGIAMFYATSAHNQERMVWKKSGLKRMERSGNYPIVHLNLGETSLKVDVPKEGMKQEYSYKDIFSILEIERLFLLETVDKTWQFVAKSAFSNREEMDEFIAFIEGKIEDAKQNPEKYELVQEEDKEEVDEVQTETVHAEGETGDVIEESEPEIEPVDISKMGKIAKMAHIMAALERDSKEEEAGEAEEIKEAEAQGDEAEANDSQNS